MVEGLGAQPAARKPAATQGHWEAPSQPGPIWGPRKEETGFWRGRLWPPGLLFQKCCPHRPPPWAPLRGSGYLAVSRCPRSIWEGALGAAARPEALGEAGGSGSSGARGAGSRRPRVPAPHTACASPQVVAIDLDEGLNGLVSYRMQVGMPRMDFAINSSSGVVVTTAELDRERIAEYQLRVVATDAGTPTKSSTNTLTIRGEGRLR